MQPSAKWITTVCMCYFKISHVRASVLFFRFKLPPTHSFGAALPTGPNLKKHSRPLFVLPFTGCAFPGCSFSGWDFPVPGSWARITPMIWSLNLYEQSSLKWLGHEVPYHVSGWTPYQWHVALCDPIGDKEIPNVYVFSVLAAHMYDRPTRLDRKSVVSVGHTC